MPLTNMTDSVHCAKCDQPIHDPSGIKPEDRKPCPNCGSTVRRFIREVSDSFTLKSQLGFKAKRARAERPFIEGLGGDDQHRNSGKWMRKERVIDREKDKYKEVVTDPETGKVIHRREEALSKHVGHGNAKKKKP